MRTLFLLCLALLVTACSSRVTLTPTAVPPGSDDGRPPTLAPPRAPAAVTPRPAAPAEPAAPEAWTHFTTADGLPSNDLLSVAATNLIATGIEQACILTTSPLANSVWVGTNGTGLAMWDGARWTTTTTTTPGVSLADNHITALFVMPRGRVLIGTERGLSTHCPNKANLLWRFGVVWTPPTNRVQAAANFGNIHWYGHPEGTRVMYQGHTLDKLFTTAQGLGANDTRAFVGDGQLSRVWAGTYGGGIAVFDTASRDTIRIRGLLTTANSGLGSDYVTSLTRDAASGVMWIGLAPDPQHGRPGGVSRYDSRAPSGSQWQTFTAADGSLPSDDVRAVALDLSGDLWVGTGSGLARRAASGVWTTYTVASSGGGLGSDDISAISIGPDNSKWIATRGGGLSRLSGAPPPPTTATPVPSATTPPPASTATRTPTPTAEAALYRAFLPLLARATRLQN